MSDSKKPTEYIILDPNAEKNMQQSEKKDKSRVVDLILSTLEKSQKMLDAERMSFDVDPLHSEFTGVYRIKKGLIPDNILKLIAGPQGDELVNQIIQTRCNLLSLMAHPRTSRFSIGYDFQLIDKHITEKLNEKLAQTLQNDVDKAKELLWTCGYEIDEEPLTLSQCMKMIVRDALVYGRVAIEFIYSRQYNEIGALEEKCVAFRPVDASTIYKLLPHEEKNEQRRRQALKLLSQIKHKEINEEMYLTNNYKYIQIINNTPFQVFTDKEMVVYNFYPTNTIEYNGYPVTPIDLALNAIITHIHIGLHNRLYFEQGRASKGMLVIQSDDVDETIIRNIGNQFQQSINSSLNAWRVPVFSIGSNSSISWQSTDVAMRDKEFQLLSEDTARLILAAFQISPDELPSFSYLSRAAYIPNASESVAEFQLLANRDIGLRPLLYDIQDLFNTYIVPKLFPNLNKHYTLVFAGLENNTPEKEAARLQQDMTLHMTYDEIMEKTNKKKIGKNLGGELPLNPTWNATVAPFLSVGQILEGFFGIEGASQDIRFNYYRDPYWIQYQQILLQKMQIALQQQILLEQKNAPSSQQVDLEGLLNNLQQNNNIDVNNNEHNQNINKSVPQLSINELNTISKLQKNINDNNRLIQALILHIHNKLKTSHSAHWHDISSQTLNTILKELLDEISNEDK